MRERIPGAARLSFVTWREYTRLLRLFEERPGWRLTYDRGELEIVSPTSRISPAEFLSSLVWTWAEATGHDILAVGSTTFRLRSARCGLEADKSFYLRNEYAVRPLREIDLRTHPPPDLALEVAVTRRALPRMPVYAALGFPEVWRLRRGALTCWVLRDGRYEPADVSEQLPGLRPARLVPFLEARRTDGHTATVRRFREIVQQTGGQL